MAVAVDDRVQARAAVMITAGIVADPAHATVDDVVGALEAAHYDDVTAERLALLVPLAFGRVALKAEGVEHFAWTVRIDADDDVVVQLDIKDDLVFLEGLRHAVERFERGVDDAFTRVAQNSAEVGAAEHAKAAGEDIRQARLHETVWRSHQVHDVWTALGARVLESPEFPKA